jgi:hypothetical protein
VEEERPARRHDERARERLRAAGEPREQQRHDRQARDREEGRDRPQPLEPEAELRHRPGEQEVERRAPALLQHDLEHLHERVPADEERQRLVLVRGPREQLVEEERGARRGHEAHSEHEPAGLEPCPRERPLAGA